MTDPVSLTFGILGVVGSVIQTYNAVMSAYNLYLDVKDVPSEYQDLRMGLLLEHQRLELWGSHVLAEYFDERNRSRLSQKHVTTWQTMEWIFGRIMEAFVENNQILDDYGQQLGLPPAQGNSSVSQWVGRLSLSAKTPAKHGFSSYTKKVKFVLTKQKKMRDLVMQLSHWNNGLDQLTSRLDQDSSRRRLRTIFSTSDTTQLRRLEAAADLLEHRDIQLMAAARIVVEQGYLSEQPDCPPELVVSSPDPDGRCIGTSPSSGYRLEMDQLKWQGKPYATDQIRAMARYGEESVIVDWRCCQDDSWRRTHPRAFRRRTENLTRILNSDLKPLSLSILHCVGYLNQSHNVTGYAFRLPDGAQPGQEPITLYDLLKRVERPNQPKDIPDLGERFELAKALVTTVFNIHNIGWVHKNIQSKNILFWPKPDAKDEPDVSRPYLMGFDISRPNQPGEVSEKPLSHFEDDLYRHPHYKGMYASSFQPSYDIYSLGVILYEIGVWRNIAYQGSSKSNNPRRPSLPTYNSDPQLVERMVEQGSIMALKQYTGARYRDAVRSCLSRDFENLWAMEAGDQHRQLQVYLEQFQNTVVDKLASITHLIELSPEQAATAKARYIIHYLLPTNPQAPFTMNRSLSVRSKKDNASTTGSTASAPKHRFTMASLRGMQQPELSKKLFKIIKSENHAIGAYESASRERISIASQLSDWGEATGDDTVSDISDKLGVLLSELGEQEDVFAQNLEDYRGILKQIRNTESSVQPSRNHKAKISDEIAKLKYKEPESTKIVQLEQELVRAEAQNLVAEAQLTNITRQKLKEAYDLHFAATIERAEKQIMLARHGRRLLNLLDDTPVVPGDTRPAFEHAHQARQILNDAEEDLRDWTPNLEPIPSAATELGSNLMPAQAGTATTSVSGQEEESMIGAGEGTQGQLEAPAPPEHKAFGGGSTVAQPEAASAY